CSQFTRACSWMPRRTVHSFFFFQSSGHPRDLHSFPTRRSSDLLAWPQQCDGGIAVNRSDKFFMYATLDHPCNYGALCHFCKVFTLVSLDCLGYRTVRPSPRTI